LILEILNKKWLGALKPSGAKSGALAPSLRTLAA
jgi:hypothetical protein